MTLDHQIFRRWPARDPDRLQLFSAPTPNGVKVGIMLEETNLAYEPHRIEIMADEAHYPDFLALNPNGKIPAIYDPNGPSCTSLALSESGAILLYLADKTGQFISADPNIHECRCLSAALPFINDGSRAPTCRDRDRRGLSVVQRRGVTTAW